MMILKVKVKVKMKRIKMGRMMKYPNSRASPTLRGRIMKLIKSKLNRMA
jgi:hypothetical protein